MEEVLRVLGGGEGEERESFEGVWERGGDGPTSADAQ